jgi:hypothetical protein
LTSSQLSIALIAQNTRNTNQFLETLNLRVVYLKVERKVMDQRGGGGETIEEGRIDLNLQKWRINR